jgi:hypothetical protein
MGTRPADEFSRCRSDRARRRGRGASRRDQRRREAAAARTHRPAPRPSPATHSRWSRLRNRCRQSDRPASGEDTGDELAGVGLTADDPDRILHVDPAELIISANVRVDPRLDKTFLASIKADGLAEVITVYRNESWDLVVLKGQRRTTVAVGTPTGAVPVRVLPKPADPTASSSSWSRTSIAPT